ncbi:MAG: hypothetical protein QOG03_647 [Actinomycetota bacterium]|jgi:hypothetical protein|nr:hypothetical protein [Actinomycetota bacterium]
MVLLTTATGEFHARVLAARLGADGILTELTGVSCSPYPVLSRKIEVLVDEDDFDTARQLLLADEVDHIFELALDDDVLHTDDGSDRSAGGSPRWMVLLAVMAIIGLAATMLHY